MKYNISLRLLNYAHIIHKSLKVQAELLKDASAKMFAVTLLIARRDTILMRFLWNINYYYLLNISFFHHTLWIYK